MEPKREAHSVAPGRTAHRAEVTGQRLAVTAVVPLGPPPTATLPLTPNKSPSSSVRPNLNHMAQV